MSQFTLTPEEDSIVKDALRSMARQHAAMLGTVDPALEALITKVEVQLPTPVAAPIEEVLVEEVVVEEAPAEEAAEEKPAKAKKAKAEDEAPAAE